MRLTGPCLPLFLLLAVALGGCRDAAEDDAPPRQRLNPLELLGGGERLDFRLAQAPRVFRFPEDHGPHEGFRNEWWYLTGNLRDATGARYGYQLTFFRHALHPPFDPGPGASAWRGNSAWMAHVALSDLSAGRHYAAERFSRENPGLAGARAQPFAVWLEDWRIAAGAAGEEGPWELSVTTEDFRLALTLAPVKAPVLQGDEGLSRKNAEAGNASYYYSLTRIATEGSIERGGERRRVRGESWLDREWSSSALAEDQSGWDWFSLQFDDGRELMYYRLRDLEGGTHPFSAGNLTTPEARQIPLAAGDIGLSSLREWEAPSGTRYTTEWRLDHGEESWLVRALLEDQWMDLSVAYWEGAVEVLDAESGEPLGQGYVEMLRDQAPGTAPAPR